MTAPTSFFHPTPTQSPASKMGLGGASSSSNVKRKRMSWGMEDYTYEETKHFRVRSPPLDRRQTFPGGSINTMPPDLIPDTSAPASDDDQAMEMDHPDMRVGGPGLSMSMDMQMRASMGMGMGMGMAFGHSVVDQTRIRADSMDSAASSQYAYASGGSGGFGFGPGAEEDEEDMGGSGKPSYPAEIYPSLTPHPNPHHFSNQPPHHHQPLFPTSTSTSTSAALTPNPGFFASAPAPPARAPSPLSAQSFTTALRPPVPAVGLLQPQMAAPLGENATDIERARAAHGPQCKSIPKLVLSQHADPVTGKRSLWAHCGDCGAVERTS